MSKQAAALEPIHGELAFRAYLRELCDKSSVNQVAAEAGISPSALSNLMAGRMSLGAKTVARFGYGRAKTITFMPLKKGKPDA